jgi:hypothetical protein
MPFTTRIMLSLRHNGGAHVRAREGAARGIGAPPLDRSRGALSRSRRAQATEPGCGAEPHASLDERETGTPLAALRVVAFVPLSTGA